jgi:hypothetical protein
MRFYGFIFFLVLVPELSRAEIAPADFVQLGQFYETRIAPCAEKIWPATNYLNDEIVLISTETRQARRLFQGRMEEIPFAPGMEKVTTYSLRKDGDRRIVWYNADGGDSLDVIDGSFHEAFHFMHQDEIEKHYQPQSRGGSFPQDPEARLFRHHMIHRFFDAYRGRATGLNEAAFWQREYELKVKGEEHAYDMIEGSANYAGMRARAIAQLGCQATEAELQAVMVARLDALYRPGFERGEIEVDPEYYVLGAFAFLMQDPAKLAAFVASLQGEPLLSAAFKGVSPIEDSVQPSLRDVVEKTVQRSNEQFQMVHAQFAALRAEKAPAADYVVVPKNLRTEAFVARAFLFSKTGEQYVKEVSKFPTKVGVLAGDMQLVSDISQLCGKNSSAAMPAYIFPLSAVEKTADAITLKAADFTLSLKYPQGIREVQIKSARLQCLDENAAIVDSAACESKLGR